MPNDPQVDILIKAQDQAGKTFDAVADKSEQTAKGIQVNWNALGASLVAVGAGLEAAGRKAAEQNDKLDKLSIATGLTSDALRDLTTETANYTRPVSETIELFEIAGQRGAKTAKELDKFAAFWDTVGDAIGGNSRQLAKYGTALQSMGIELGKEEKALAALGYAQTETTLGAEGFLRILERSAPEIRELGLNIDQTAAIFGILEDRGITGRKAQSEFAQAVNTSKGNMDGFLQIMGLTRGELELYANKVEDSGNKIMDMADAHAEHYTIIQKLTHGWSELFIKHGELIEKASQIAPIFIGIGTAMLAVVNVGPALISTFSGIAVALNVSTGGLLAIMAGITAGVVALYAAWKTNWLGIQDITRDTIGRVVSFFQESWPKIKEFFMPVVYDLQIAWEELRLVLLPVLYDIEDAILTAMPIIADMISWAVEAISTVWRDHFYKVWDITKVVAKGVLDAIVWWMDNIYPIIEDTLDFIYSIIIADQKRMEEAGSELMKSLASGVVAAAFLPVDAVFYVFERIKAHLPGFGTEGPITEDTMKEVGYGLMKSLGEWIKFWANLPVEAMVFVADEIRKRLPGSDAELGPLSDLSASARAIPETIADAITAFTPAVARVMNGLADAALPSPEIAYNIANALQEIEARVKGGVQAGEGEDYFAGIKTDAERALGSLGIAGDAFLNVWADITSGLLPVSNVSPALDRINTSVTGLSPSLDTMSASMSSLPPVMDTVTSGIDGMNLSWAGIEPVLTERSGLLQEYLTNENMMVQEFGGQKVVMDTSWEDLITANRKTNYDTRIQLLAEYTDEYAQTYDQFIADNIAVLEEASTQEAGILERMGENWINISYTIEDAMTQAMATAENVTYQSTGNMLAYIQDVMLALAAMQAQAASQNVPTGGGGGGRQSGGTPPIPAQGIPEMQAGGIVTSPTLAMIGEAGPEAVIPLSQGMGQPPVIINLNIQGGLWSGRPEDLQTLIREALPYVNAELAR